MALTSETALQYLRRAHRDQRLAHAYLISGPPGSGKFEVAANFAAGVNATTPELVLSGRAPDVIITEPASRSRRIVIEEIRSLERVLQLQVPATRTKIAIIRDAERMQPQAANAFLKTLEEPPQNSLLVLLSALPEALPDTIVSRCLSLALRTPSTLERSAQEAELLRTLCAGSEQAAGEIALPYRIFRALQGLLDEMRDEIRTEHARELKNDEQRYRNTTDGAWLDDREDHYKALTESLYRERRSRLLETLFLWWADVLRAKVATPARLLEDCRGATQILAARLTTAEVLRRIQRLEEMRDQLNTTAQEALVLEIACLHLFR